MKQQSPTYKTRSRAIFSMPYDGRTIQRPSHTGRKSRSCWVRLPPSSRASHFNSLGNLATSNKRNAKIHTRDCNLKNVFSKFIFFCKRYFWPQRSSNLSQKIENILFSLFTGNAAAAATKATTYSIWLQNSKIGGKKKLRRRKFAKKDFSASDKSNSKYSSNAGRDRKW